MRIMLYMLLLAGFCSISFAGDLKITPTVKYQTIEGIGGALAMYEGWIPSHPYKDEIYDTLFKWTGISLLRLGNWLQDTLGDISADSSIAIELRKRNPDAKILVSSWSPPSNLKANNSPDGNKTPNSLKKENGKYVYDQFGHWWKSSIRRFNSCGIKPDYITIQNEINWSPDYSSCLFNPTENDTIAAFAPALRAVHDSIATLTQYPRILAPEVLGTGYNALESYAPTLDTSKFYGWAFHFYGSGDYSNPPTFISNPTASFSELMKTIQYKPRFMTEYCNLDSKETPNNTVANPDTSKDWINLASIMQEAFTGLNLTGWVFWDLAWGNTGNMVAVLPSWDRSNWPKDLPHGYFVHRTLHALGQYSRFVRGGWVRVDASPADTVLKVSAFLSPKGDSISVIIVNPGYSSVTFTPKIENASNASGDVWTTSSTQAIEKSGTWDYGKNLTVAARTVTTITGNLSKTSARESVSSLNHIHSTHIAVKSGKVEIRLEQSMQGTVELLDLTGHLCKRISTGLIPAGTHEFSTGDIPNGMYIVRLVSETGRLAQKFVKIAPDCK